MCVHGFNWLKSRVQWELDCMIGSAQWCSINANATRVLILGFLG